MTQGGAHPLDRAADLARREPVDPALWERTAATVMRRIHASIRPGRPLRVPLDQADGSRTFVNERVLVLAVRRALQRFDDLAPSHVRLAVEGLRCTEVRLDLVVRYGADLHALGERCRAAVGETLTGLLLEDADAVDVRVSVVDVTLEDPRL